MLYFACKGLRLIDKNKALPKFARMKPFVASLTYRSLLVCIWCQLDDYAIETRTNPPHFTLRLLQVKQPLERLGRCLSLLPFGNGKAKTADIALSSYMGQIESDFPV